MTATRRTREHQQAVLDRRRSSATTPIPSGRIYRRRPKHTKREDQP